MIKIKIYNQNNLVNLMKKFKKMCEKEGIFKDLRKKEFYEKPSEQRRRKRRMAAKKSAMERNENNY